MAPGFAAGDSRQQSWQGETSLTLSPKETQAAAPLLALTTLLGSLDRPLD